MLSFLLGGRVYNDLVPLVLLQGQFSSFCLKITASDIFDPSSLSIP